MQGAGRMHGRRPINSACLQPDGDLGALAGVQAVGEGLELRVVEDEWRRGHEAREERRIERSHVRRAFI